MTELPSFSRRNLLRGALGAAVVSAGGLLLPSPVGAQEFGELKVVNSDSVRLRAKPGTSSAIVETLGKGTRVTVITNGSTAANGYQWINVQVRSNGKLGWIASSFLDNGSWGDTEWGELPHDAAIWVNTDRLNFRTAPGGTVIRTLTQNTRLQFRGVSTVSGVEWVRAYLTTTGETGHLAAEFLTWNRPGGGSDPGWAAGKGVSVINGSLNLRSGPSLTSPIINLYKQGTQAEVISGPTAADGHNWYRVRVYVDGRTGYFAAAGLAADDDGPATDRIRVVDGPVNLRALPGLKGTVVGTLRTGEGGDLWSTSLVLADGYNWIKIRVDSTQKIGWLAAQFINYV